MSDSSLLRILLLFAVAFSLASLPGVLSTGSSLHLPTIHAVRANPAPTEAWYPAGPAMNTELVTIFTDETAEFNCFNTASPCVDLTDWPLSPVLLSQLTPNPSYSVTSPISATQYFELQFMLANNFWGVAMNFGNNPNGTEIRQGIAHLIDKVSFTNNEPAIAGSATPIDNPVPLNNGGLLGANPCQWDASFPQAGTNCTVGAPGGTSYHLAAATGVNYPWQPALGSSDFCAAAQHFINAGLATGKDPTTCVLTGISPAVTSHTVNLFARIDDPARLDLGTSIAQEICALFGQGFVTGCSPYLTFTPGPITAFVGFITSNNSVNLNWHIYTAGYSAVYPFSSSLYFIYNSQFVSGIPTIQQSGGGFCTNSSVPTFSAGDYMYLCNPPYDDISSQIESASCVSGPGDPSAGQTTPTLAVCTGAPGSPYTTNDFTLSSAETATGVSLPTTLTFPADATSLGSFAGTVSLNATVTPIVAGGPTVTYSSGNTVTIAAGSQGSRSVSLAVPSSTPANTYTITIGGSSGPLSHKIKLTLTVASGQASIGSISTLTAISAGYLSEDRFGRGTYTVPMYTISDQFAYLSNWSRVINDQGTGIPNYFTWLDAYSATPAIPGTIRQAFKQATNSLNPYIYQTVWESYIVNNIYDTLEVGNPMSNGQLIEWMTLNSRIMHNNELGYAPPAGTTATYRFNLRGDLFWQDGKRVTSWDVKFSYQSLKATGAFQSGGLAPMTGIHIFSSTSFDVNVNSAGPFTELFLTSPTIIPGRYWSVCPGSTWDTDVNLRNVPDSCMSVDPSKITATFDPLANHILIGSGPWECVSQTGVVGTGCSSSGTMNPQPGSGTFTLTRFGKGTSPGAGLNDHYFRSNGNLALWIWTQNNGEFTHDFINFSIVEGCYGQVALPLGSTSACAHFQEGIGGNGGPTVVGAVQVSIVNRFIAVNWVAPFVWNTAPPVGLAALSPVLYEGSATLNPASIAGCTTPYPTGGYDC